MDEIEVKVNYKALHEAIMNAMCKGMQVATATTMEKVTAKLSVTEDELDLIELHRKICGKQVVPVKG